MLSLDKDIITLVLFKMGQRVLITYKSIIIPIVNTLKKRMFIPLLQPNGHSLLPNMLHHLFLEALYLFDTI